ncbi:MAG: alanine--tRNA ligase [Bacteroidia bacterium]|nr:alanine--tRNA ligase [Bacteroidia bacterium]MDW8347965.1 alanine--tRNA ligase [Bacteroidia bacterium]
MKSAHQIRQEFLDFFKQKQHEIVPSAPMVIKGDPTLLFTNSGMNQFKEWFLGYTTPKYLRVADTQKCLRASGKHNDLEDVGVDTYHHTMFEMLGNWSFGDYFKKEAIAWAWELLTEVWKLPKDRLYVTYFNGDTTENLEPDIETKEIWKQYISEDRIKPASKKDNFWEMGATGPCGPCTEIHIDIRTENERRQINGYELINADNPKVIEIWNLVFMQFERKADGTLVPLPAKHVDTGMGFERICAVMNAIETNYTQTSNYDTSVFQPIIEKIEQVTQKKYTRLLQDKKDIAIRVLADHIRTIAFAIADGQLPSNTGAGYVIRRILRRAVRYYYSFLERKEPTLCLLVDTLSEQMKPIFPELDAQKNLIIRVIQEEERSFLRTLERGIQLFESYHAQHNTIDGQFAFELYDTYGFPLDLTQLLAREKGLKVDTEGFEKAMQVQKDRSREATKINAGDWVTLKEIEQVEHLIYQPDFNSTNKITEAPTDCHTFIAKYRTVTIKNKTQYQVVLEKTPFYAEAGGQIGDTGTLTSVHETITVLDTFKENNLIIHAVDKLPEKPHLEFYAQVDVQKRKRIMANHTATHLLNAALRQVLGNHVTQKGSYVGDAYLRFDFSHFSKLTDEELEKIENIVNEKIKQGINQDTRWYPIQEAQKLGAQMVFGEKYGEQVRVVTFDPHFSMEFCGGLHVLNTQEIRLFKLVSESSITAGVRRIEAITGDIAFERLQQQQKTIQVLQEWFKTKDVLKAVEQLIEKNKSLEQQLLQAQQFKVQMMVKQLKAQAIEKEGTYYIFSQIDADSTEMVRQICFELKHKCKSVYLVLVADIDQKPHISVMLSEDVVAKGANAIEIVRELAKEIQGGGGGQPFFATAGGKNVQGLSQVLEKAKKMADIV